MPLWRLNGVEIWGVRWYVGTGKYSLPFKSIADRLIAMNLDIVHDYNLPSVAIRLFEVPRESEIQ